MSALRAGIYEDGTNFTFTGIASLAALSLAVQVGTDPGSKFGMIYCRNDGAQALDAFLVAQDAGAIGAVAMSGDITWNSSDFRFPVLIGSTKYWLLLSADTV